ncbi:MAG: GLPGLI family protein [Bacteroidia bacterium]|nr:GLPGLI family protein [Bacteroidia bacterium]MDW8348054.1 GLPGLI family protein [Bacteroidia bacterium]
MKTCFIIIVSLVYCIYGYSQNLSGVIKYRFWYSYSVEMPENATVIGSPAQEFDLPAYLYFNTQKSLFDYDKTEYNRNTPYQNTRKDDEHGQMYYIDKTLGELYIREFIYGKPYITHEPIPVINWQIKNEVKTILGYACKKATAEFRGRKYVVWYTSAIPVSVGPWKLQGLPGAVLEAESEDKEVKFVAESVRIPAYVESKLNITHIPDGTILTYREYLATFENERKKREEGGYNFMINALSQQQKEGKIKDLPKRESMKITIFKMFTIEKHE